MKKYVKIMVLMLCMVFTVGILSACSLMGPKDAKSAFEKYYKVSSSVENYHTDIDMDMKMDMGFEDKEMASQLEQAMGVSSFEVPFDIGMSMDVGKESAHGDIDMAMSLMGQSEKEKGEMYIDIADGYTYTKMDSEDSWTKSEYEESAMNQLITEADLKDVDWSKFKFEKTDNGYVATIAMEDVPSLLDSAGGYLGDVDFDDYEIDGGDIVFTFDKKCMLTKMEMKDVKMAGKVDVGSGLGNMTCDIDINVVMDVSKVNELKAEDYEIPSKVKKDVDDTDDSGLGIDSIFGGDSGEPTVIDEPTGEDEPTGAAAGSGTVLDGSKVKDDRYLVGRDIKPGTYKVYRTSKSGSGVATIYDAETFDSNYTLNMGYGLDTDNPDGTTVVLENGDEIYMTDELILEFR